MNDDMTKDEKREYWEMVLEEYESSGMNKSEYCRVNDICKC